MEDVSVRILFVFLGCLVAADCSLQLQQVGLGTEKAPRRDQLVHHETHVLWGWKRATRGKLALLLWEFCLQSVGGCAVQLMGHHTGTGGQCDVTLEDSYQDGGISLALLLLLLLVSLLFHARLFFLYTDLVPSW